MANSGTVPDLQTKSGAADTLWMRPRIVLADDHPELLVEIGRLLMVECDLLCSVCEGFALVKAASELKPDVVISDIKMPHLSGIEAGHQILQAGLSKSAIMLTTYDEPELVRSALEAGIRGYVLKVDAGEELIPAVKTVLLGHTYLSRRVLKKWTR